MSNGAWAICDEKCPDCGRPCDLDANHDAHAAYGGEHYHELAHTWRTDSAKTPATKTPQKAPLLISSGADGEESPPL